MLNNMIVINFKVINVQYNITLYYNVYHQLAILIQIIQ